MGPSRSFSCRIVILKRYRNAAAVLPVSLVDILDLGIQPLANALVKNNHIPVKKFPLSSAFCPSCCLFQLKETVKKEILFDRYFWVTGTSLAAKQYARIFFERTVKLCQLDPKDFVLEIASNDGTILKQFVQANYQGLGVEPAQNIARIAEEAGVKTLCAYWNRSTAKNIVGQYGHAKVVIARNVIPHVSELHEAIEGMHDALDDEGVGIIEFHDGGIILRELHYDSIYHEHLCYFTVKSMTSLLNRYHLYPFHIDPSPISGGSHVIYFSRKQRPQDDTYRKAMHAEGSSRTNDLASWKNFAQKAFEHKQHTLQLVSSFKDQRIVGFGASARSSTYLNFCGLTSAQINGIIDNNPLKQGFYTAGSNIPIISKEQGLALKPDVIFVLAWNLKDEIINECRKAGFRGKFLIPFPQVPRIIDSGDT